MDRNRWEFQNCSCILSNFLFGEWSHSIYLSHAINWSMKFACSFHFRMKCWQLSLEKHAYDLETSKCVHSPNSCKWRFRANICQEASFTWSLASVVTPRCLQNSDFLSGLIWLHPKHTTTQRHQVIGECAVGWPTFSGPCAFFWHRKKKTTWDVGEYQRLDMLL